MKLRHLAAIVVVPVFIATACSGDDDDAVSQADSTASADDTASSAGSPNPPGSIFLPFSAATRAL